MKKLIGVSFGCLLVIFLSSCGNAEDDGGNVAREAAEYSGDVTPAAVQATPDTVQTAGPAVADSSSSSPEGSLRKVFQLTKEGNMSEIKQFISSGYLDNYDANHLRDIFGAQDVSDIEVQNLGQDNQRAVVKITIIRGGGKFGSDEVLPLVWQDGLWKIDYSGVSWPKALRASKYSIES